MSDFELNQLRLLVEKFHASYPNANVLLTYAPQEQVDDLIFGANPLDFVHFDIALDSEM
jgi:hypothetical protein